MDKCLIKEILVRIFKAQTLKSLSCIATFFFTELVIIIFDLNKKTSSKLKWCIMTLHKRVLKLNLAKRDTKFFTEK